MILVFLASMLFVLAWRGRVVARGRFCKKCKFDLAGLDLGSADARCPECGRVVHDASARRVLLRRPSRVGIGITAGLVVLSVGLIWFGVSGKGGMLLGVLPDSTVFWLNDLGVDEAHDEIVVRVSRVDEPMEDVFLSRAIEGALAHQADLEQVWDPRWGEVLAQMFGNPVMTDEQMLQYLRNGMEVEIEIRDRVHAGDQRVDTKVSAQSNGRISAMTLNNTGYYLFIKPVKGGVVDGPVHEYRKNDGLGINFTLHRRGGPTLPWNGTIPVGSGFEVEPGTLVPVYIEYELRLSELGAVASYRGEQSVLILAPDEPIVPLFDDPVLAGEVCRAISVSTVRVIQEVYDVDPMRGHSVLAIRTQFEPMGVSTAFDVFLRFNDGEEVSIGGLIHHDPDLQRRGGIMTWPGDIFTQQVRAPTIPIVERLKAEGQVDVLMRPNPRLADDIPGIERVLNASLEFLDVPVEIVVKEFDLQKSASKPEEQHAGECP